MARAVCHLNPVLVEIYPPHIYICVYIYVAGRFQHKSDLPWKRIFALQYLSREDFVVSHTLVIKGCGLSLTWCSFDVLIERPGRVEAPGPPGCARAAWKRPGRLEAPGPLGSARLVCLAHAWPGVAWPSLGPAWPALAKSGLADLGWPSFEPDKTTIFARTV